MNKPKSPQLERHRARRLAMQGLYQWYYDHTEVHELSKMMLEEKGETKIDRDYFHGLLQGTINHIQEIDAALLPLLDRTLKELNPVELAILRVMGFELLYKPEIPYRVVINEGVELAKAFGSDQGHKFVNAVLDKLARHCRVVEIKK